MPTYDYLCKACGAAHEFFQSMSERPKRKCPSCGASKLERQIGAGAGILFKGSGFYETDYRSDSYAKAKEADSKAPAKEEPKSADTKPSSKAKKGKAKGKSD